ncbi:MAG: acyl-CoA dehydrogenase [Proteobacteria bacterium]|nr:acyl-CoA dehydrogenase [Pseudomonadota bacterium]NIS71539.1 acyl-CoA dehydrogenase [Pseudomonadota bacterium]
MDFSLTPEQVDIQKAARDFAQGEFDPDRTLEYDHNQEFPLIIWKKASELGFIGVQFPEEYGGQGLGLLENALIVEAFCSQDSGIGTALALSDFGSEIVLRHGDENQKRKFLPFVTQGKGLSTLAFLEEGDPQGPYETTSRLNQDGYIIHGMKTLVPFGSLAHYLVVVCQAASDEHLGQSILLVARQTKGLAPLSMGQKVGMRMVPLDQISFKSVRVPPENRIGHEGSGEYQLRNFFDEIRIETGAMGVGIAQAGLDRAVDYSKRREQFGRPIVKFDVIRNKLADMYTEVEVARLMAYKAAWSFDQGKPDHRSILMAKMIASRAAYRVTYETVQIHAGTGYMTESHVEHFYRDARVLDLFLESEPVQRRRLADEITRLTK